MRVVLGLPIEKAVEYFTKKAGKLEPITTNEQLIPLLNSFPIDKLTGCHIPYQFIRMLIQLPMDEAVRIAQSKSNPEKNINISELLLIFYCERAVYQNNLLQIAQLLKMAELVETKNFKNKQEIIAKLLSNLPFNKAFDHLKNYVPIIALYLLKAYLLQQQCSITDDQLIILTNHILENIVPVKNAMYGSKIEKFFLNLLLKLPPEKAIKVAAYINSEALINLHEQLFDAYWAKRLENKGIATIAQLLQLIDSIPTCSPNNENNQTIAVRLLTEQLLGASPTEHRELLKKRIMAAFKGGVPQDEIDVLFGSYSGSYFASNTIQNVQVTLETLFEAGDVMHAQQVENEKLKDEILALKTALKQYQPSISNAVVEKPGAHVANSFLKARKAHEGCDIFFQMHSFI